MSIPTSVLDELLQRLPALRPQMYFKSSLTALSHAIEDQVLAAPGHPLVIANFQRERFYQQEAQRYRRIAERTSQVYVLAAPETSFKSGSGDYERIAFDLDDALCHEWHLIVISAQYSTCLVCRERQAVDPDIAIAEEASGESQPADCPSTVHPSTTNLAIHHSEDEFLPGSTLPVDHVRRFEGVWTFDRHVCAQAADIMLDRILAYRPELVDKVNAVRTSHLAPRTTGDALPIGEIDPDPFAHRLMTYLQAGQYKLLKAYRSMAAQERRERLVNLMTSAIRQSLDPDHIFSVAVQELGQTMGVCRCLIYPCRPRDESATIDHEFLVSPSLTSTVGETLPLKPNPLFQAIAQGREAIAIADTRNAPDFDLTPLQPLINRLHIRSWLMVPILHQGQLIGMVELHGCGKKPRSWETEEIEMVEAIAVQLGVALIQADAYANLETLNQQLEALERTRSNLIAITGHELRTPLSTIQVCLESLASEPDMPLELRQVMLSTALDDAERLRKLVQDFLTLSQLESGRVEWHLEALSLEECMDLALSSIRTRQRQDSLPIIKMQVPDGLPLVRADGEWLVEVLSKLLDNACKFTEPEGEVKLEAHRNGQGMLEVTITDTGRGIEPNRLEAVFDRFYQEEGALRRTAGGTGLGLAICRQVIRHLGGQIWAESAGRGQGSQFHFTIPVVGNVEATPARTTPEKNGAAVRSRKSRTSKRRAKLK
ncbi:MAG: DICT sensory domain-containing protein [Synechococcales bacterium]|nr:DICT sensory domain-containing protein [Synechococcales bacterium]